MRTARFWPPLDVITIAGVGYTYPPPHQDTYSQPPGMATPEYLLLVYPTH